MKFQVFLLKNSKRRLITYLILITLFCFFVTSIPANAGLFGEKIKKISDNELKEVIKVELNLSRDPNFYSYTDSILKEALDREINSQETPGLTFGNFILDALYEEKLVEMCYPNFDDKESSLFFSKLADNLSDWQENFASKTTKLAIQGVIEAYLKMPNLGIGTSTLFLAIDLAQINVAMAKLAKVIHSRALFYYLFNRSQGDSHETAWGEGIPPLYDNWQTESFFQSIWNKYGEAILSDNLARFKEEQHEMLRVLILQALNRPPNLPTNMIQFKSDGKTILKIGKTTTEKTVILKAKVSDPDQNKVKLQIELRRLDEYEGKFDEERGGLQQSDLFKNNSEIMIPIYGLADGDYHWRARAIDEYGLVSKWVSFGGNPDSAVDFTVGQAVAAPIITSPLKITSDSPYYVGDTINAEFSITNKESIPIILSVLTIGGRDPDNHVSDFTHRQNIILEPSESYDYKGALTLNKVGDYHFFCTYQTPDGNWNTCVDLGSGLTDEDRTEDIIVKEKPFIVPDISEELYIEWEKTFGGNKLDEPNFITQTKDGGYAITGWTISEGYPDTWIIKLDEQGNTLWEKTFGRNELGKTASSIIQTKDEGYAVAGNAYSKDTGRVDTWIIKLDEQGNTLWEKTFGKYESKVVAQSIIQTKDGGYAVTGWTRSKDYQDPWIIKLDEQGNTLWEKTFGENEFGGADSIIQTKDGGYAVTGWTPSKKGCGNAWITKLDEQGNVLWKKTFGENELNRADSIIQTKDGGYIVAKRSSSCTWAIGTEEGGTIKFDARIIKLDEQGNVLWEKTFGRNESSGPDSIIQTKDGGYVVTGWTPSKSHEGAWITKLDEQGNTLWKKTFGENEFGGADSIIQTKDGGYVVAGCTILKGAEESNAWITKLDEQGNVLWKKTFGENELNRANSIIQTKDGSYAVAGGTRLKGAEEWDWDVRIIKLKIGSTSTSAEQVTKEKLLIDSSLYHIECNKPIVSGNIFVVIPVSVSGPADELGIILTNPEGWSTTRFISKRDLIDNFESIEVPLCKEENPPLGTYNLIIKTITPEKIVYQKELIFTPPALEITDAEVRIIKTEGVYILKKSWDYYLTDLDIVVKNWGELPIILRKVVITIKGRKTQEIEWPQFKGVPYGETKIKEGGKGRFLRMLDEDIFDSAVIKLYSFSEEDCIAEYQARLRFDYYDSIWDYE